MLNDTTQSKLLHNLFTLLGAHRPAFKQERPFLRAVGMVLGEIFSFGRHTVTQGLDAAGRTAQKLLVLADGGFDVLDLWCELPEGVILVTRTARNRCLYYLPKAENQPGPGRPALYGERAPHPADWLHAGLRNWPNQFVEVRGKQIKMRYQLLGPFVREGLSERPLFLIVVKGMHRWWVRKNLAISTACPILLHGLGCPDGQRRLAAATPDRYDPDLALAEVGDRSRSP